MTTGFVSRTKGKEKIAQLYSDLATKGIVDSATGNATRTVWTNAGTPTNGTSGTLAASAAIGDLLIDTTNKKLYQNTNTLASPTWTVFEASGGTVLLSVADGLTAHAGGGKASALALTAQINKFATVAANGDSALLPASSAGLFVFVENDGAHFLDLYGAGTDTINDIATASPFVVAAGANAVFFCSAAGAWYGIVTGGLAPASYQAQPANPTAPSSTAAYAMQGLAGSITPVKTGTVLLAISGHVIGSSTTAGDGIKVQPSYGTGAAPANAAALAGTQFGSIMQYTNPTTVTAADISVPFAVQAIVTGLTLGTAYWLDLAAESVNTASTVGLAGLSVTAVEL